MKTCIKLAFRLLQKSVFAREVILFLFTVVYAFVLLLVSAVRIKISAYTSISPFLKNNGVLITSTSLSKSSDHGGTLLRDEEELAEYLGDTDNIPVWRNSGKLL